MFTSSIEKAAGSLGEEDQVIIAGPPEETFVGVFSESAEMRGRTKVRTLRFNRISVWNWT